MKTLIRLLIISSMALLCLSCFKEDQMGYPKNVTFTKEGGTQVFIGEQGLTHFSIQDGDYQKGSEGGNYPDPKSYLQYKWITIEADRDLNKLYITAEPSTDTHSRSIYIYAYCGPSYATIKVMQK